MAEHIVYKRKKSGVYAEVYTNDPKKRGRKVFVRYIGRVFGIPDIDWKATFAGNEDGVDWHAIEQQALEQVEKQEAEYQAKLAALPEGLHVGPTDPLQPQDVDPEGKEEDVGEAQPSDAPADVGDGHSGEVGD